MRQLYASAITWGLCRLTLINSPPWPGVFWDIVMTIFDNKKAQDHYIRIWDTVLSVLSIVWILKRYKLYEPRFIIKSWWETFSFISYWPWNIGKCHPSLNLTLSFIIWITGINMEVIGPTNCRCGTFVTTTIFLYNIFIVRLHLERGMIDIRNQVADGA